MLAFRCDGGRRVGAGHVARSVQIAAAFAAAGEDVVLVGAHEGIAAELIAAADLRAVRVEPGRPLGLPAGTRAAVVDSYEIPAAEIESASRDLPVAAIVDEGPCPAVTAVLCYHLDAAERIEAPPRTRALLGGHLAPVRPALTTGRRPRGLATALVTAGGGEAGLAFAAEAARALLTLDDALEVFVAAPGTPPFADSRLSWAAVAGGLQERIAWADVAVSAAGSTPYDLACAGVPAALRPVADNQEPVARGFLAAGLAVADPAALLDPVCRAGLAAAGPARIDGYGAFRARDALAAAFAGRPAPRPLAYRPATDGDAELLLAWRNDPVVREQSRTSDPIEPAGHARWLEGVLSDPARTLLIVEREGRPAGTLRFDRAGDEAEISVTIDGSARGEGLGTQAIAEATELEFAARPGLVRVVAEVQSRNLSSLSAFERAGFVPADAPARAGWAILVRARHPRTAPDIQ